MSKLYFTTSLLCLTAAAACLPVGCADSTQSDESVGSTSAALGSTSLVISQVFGGGSATGILNQDFVEIFNPTKAAVPLTGLSLQLAAGNGDFGAGTNAIVALTGSVKAGGYFLVGLNKDGTTGTNLPTADQTGAFDLNATDGKVLIAKSTTAVNCGGGIDCAPAAYLDLVAWGGATQFETEKVTGLDGGKGAQRKNSCTDTDDNAADFAVLPPTPRNSATAALTCGTTTTKDAGGDATKPIGVTDPDLGDEDPFDSGIKTDAGKSNAAAAAADDGCSVGAVGAGNASVIGLLFAAGLAVAGRRRRSRK